mmetsp:Transcript_18448/g.23379  ORF Transcript_18448/g.23379 Transcript_18448/m.23379 type:complete len:282 (-) Transcript_18448:40-885(-)
MATAWLSQSIDEDEDVCPICIDVYMDPVSLTCKHNYCKQCALMLVKQKSTDTNSYYIQCAVCEAETLLGKDKRLKTLKASKKLRAKSKQKREECQHTSDMEEIERKMSQLNSGCIVMPKNIKLLMEYDASIGKDGKTFIPDAHNGMISYGAEETRGADSPSLTDWHAMLIGPQESPVGQVMYFLKIRIPEEFPKVPPVVNFQQPKVVMECVDEKGLVHVDKIEVIDISNITKEGCVEVGTGKKYVWDPSHTIADVLVAIRNNMHLFEVCRLSGTISQQSYV